MTKWQDVGNAPHDGSSILVLYYTPDDLMDVQFAKWDDGRWVYEKRNGEELVWSPYEDNLKLWWKPDDHTTWHPYPHQVNPEDFSPKWAEFEASKAKDKR